MVSLWCQTVWILWYFYVCIQDGLPVMSNCMNIVIFLCLYPGWSPSDVKLYEYCDILMFVFIMVSQWCQTVWILWYSYVYIQDGLPVMSNCMNIVIFLCLCSGWSHSDFKLYEYCDILMFVPRWSLSDVKLYEYCDILMFVSRMVSQWCQTVWILWYFYVCVQDGLTDVKLYEYCGILMFVSRMVSVVSNCMNIVIFLCLYPGWSPSDIKL